MTAMSVMADFSPGYYDGLDGLQREQLKAAAKKCVASHKALQYYDLPNYWQYSDVYPEPVNGCKRWWDMYSDAVYLISPGQSGVKSFSANRMQREHAVPKSWWKMNGSVEYTPAYSDMWNLYPSDGAANQAKLNYPFGEVKKATFDNGVTKVGTAEVGYGGGSAYVFEPADEYKGDFARAIFYMATVYDDINWVYDYMFVRNTYPTLTPWAYSMLLQWSRIDPVSQKEIDRNNIVEQYQGNRNPFVDFPNLAEYIWGVRTTETFIVADQIHSDPTPPITGSPEITAPINGESLDFGQAAVGHGVTRSLRITGHNLTSPLSLRVSGADRSYFVPDVASIPAATMNQNGGYLLPITYIPDAVGTHEAKLILYDGGLEGSIAVNLRAEALEMPVMETLTALPPTDLTDSGYTAHWNGPAAGIADYYILQRVRYTDNGEEIEKFETGETFYRIDNRDSNQAETYNVSYVRLGIESPESNTIYIAPAGMESIEERAHIRIYGVEGGILVLCDNNESGDIGIYSVDGHQVIADSNPEDGTYYPLSSGIYIVTISGARPAKTFVR